MNMINGGNGFFLYPFNLNQDDNDGNKMANDSYHVYVNGDYVGDKLSIAQGDGGWEAIEGYLKTKDFKGYRVSREGDHIYVDVDVDDEGDTEAIRDHLRIYTQIR